MSDKAKPSADVLLGLCEAYRTAQKDLQEAEDWYAMVGKPYHGGGGGVGRLMIKPSVQIYYQPYDGATNYHEAPRSIRSCYTRIAELARVAVESRLFELRERLDAARRDLEALGFEAKR